MSFPSIVEQTRPRIRTASSSMLITRRMYVLIKDFKLRPFQKPTEVKMLQTSSKKMDCSVIEKTIEFA